MGRYRIEVLSNEWAGTLRDGWRPAVAGTLNNTSLSDDAASTFDSAAEAANFLARFVVPEEPDQARIVEVA